MEDSLTDKLLTGAYSSSPFEFKLDYANYVSEKRFTSGRRVLFDYNQNKIALTQKQINVMKLVAKGYSNRKIAECLPAKESAVKLLTYRLMKDLEEELCEKIDRFYLVVIAQKLKLE